MSVSDLVSNGDGSLSRSMTTKAINTIMTERIWINRVTCVSAYVLKHWRSVARGACVNSVKKPNLHPELYQRDVTGGMWTPIVSCT